MVIFVRAPGPAPRLVFADSFSSFRLVPSFRRSFEGLDDVVEFARPWNVLLKKWAGVDRSGDRQGVFQVILWIYQGGLRLAVR